MKPAPYLCRRLVEDVTAYLEGSLPAETVALVEAHLADCPHCTEYLAQMRRTIAMSGAISERDVDAMPDDLRSRLVDAFQERDA
jgi:anti-sigma factor RsiW